LPRCLGVTKFMKAYIIPQEEEEEEEEENDWGTN
jgi:hypothetical protein